MKQLILLGALWLVGGLSGALAQEAPAAPAQKHIVLQSRKVLKGRPGAARIKADMPVADVAKPRSRGETCQMAFVNHTGLHIKIYIDGTFNSTIGPYGKNSVSVDGLAPVIYCKSLGGTQEWNGGGECDLGFENVFDLKP